MLRHAGHAWLCPVTPTVLQLLHPLVPGAPCSAQEAENATIPELIRLSLPDGHILLMAFTAGAAAALGQVRRGARRGRRGGLSGGQ